jgi:ribosomal protein L9
MHTVLLLTDVEGLGKAHQIVEVDDPIPLLSKRQALHATPLVRERFAEQIRLAHSPQ